MNILPSFVFLNYLHPREVQGQVVYTLFDADKGNACELLFMSCAWGSVEVLGICPENSAQEF